ncbi:hypothetical protein Tco_0323703 [Tanacetum coccineum]
MELTRAVNLNKLSLSSPKYTSSGVLFKELYLSNTITNPRCEARAITTRSGLSYTPVPPIPPPLYDVNEPLTEKETEVTKDKVLPSTKDIQPPVIQKSHDPVKPVGSPISPEPSSAQVDNSPPSKEPSKETKLPYPSRVEHEKKGENDKVQIQKFWEMFKKIHVDITLADALILMPKYQKMLKSLLSNKESECDWQRHSNECYCSERSFSKSFPRKSLVTDDFSFLKDQEEKSIAELLAEERLQKANQALNESQSPQEMRIQDLEIQKQQCLEEMKEWMNDLGIREIRKEEIDIDYRRKCEDKIYELKDKFNGLSIEIRKIIQEAEELRESEARARIQKIIIDDDDDDLGFYAVHPNTIHTPVSQNVEPKDSLIMGDGHINTTPETETISVETLVSNPSESDDFSLGECNLFDIDDSYYEKSTSRLAHLAPISPEIVEVCVDDDDTDDDDDYDDDVYVDDCVDIEEDGGEIDLDISKIVDISLREKLVESYLLIEKINAFSLSPPIPISPIFCPSSTIPVVDLDLPLEEADVPSFSDDSILRGIESDRDSGEDTTSIDALPLDDSMILPEYESFTFDDEPVMAEVNVFDEINTSELSYPGIGENVILDEEEDTFTFTTRSFLPFVTYPEVLPASYSTGSEDKVFKPGIFDNVLTRKSSLTLDVFDPLHPPLMDFHVTKAFSGFTFSLLKIFSKKFFEPGIKNATVYLSSLVWGGFHLLEFLHPHYYPP